MAAARARARRIHVRRVAALLAGLGVARVFLTSSTTGLSFSAFYFFTVVDARETVRQTEGKGRAGSVPGEVWRVEGELVCCWNAPGVAAQRALVEQRKRWPLEPPSPHAPDAAAGPFGVPAFRFPASGPLDWSPERAERCAATGPTRGSGCGHW